MQVLSVDEGVIILCLFAAVLGTGVWLKTRIEGRADGFLVADRKVGKISAALSIAVAWVWAPAIFVCSEQSFQNGVPGIFWFTLPNVLCFFFYAPLALKLRSLIPGGYTLPEYIAERFPESKMVHFSFLLIALGYQLGAIIINSLAGGTLLHAVSGINQTAAIISVALIALTYTLMSGLKASIFTDVIQMIMVLGICVVLVPLCWHAGGGLETISRGIGGISGEYSSLFNPWIAFTMGIPLSLGLIAGPINDQMFWQRAMAVRKEDVVKTFVYGGLFFAIVPIALSMLGFLGAGLAKQGLLSIPDPQLVGPSVVAALLPKAAIYAFCLMAFAGLCSTMDSACCAVSSLGSIDIFKRYIKPNATDQEILRASRISMVSITTLGTAIALTTPKLIWLFLIYSALSSAGLFPALFALYSRRVTARALSLSICAGILFGFPYSIYANITESPVHISLSAIVSVVVGLLILSASTVRARRAAPWKIDTSCSTVNA